MTLSSLSLWSMVLGAFVPFACTASECDGPGGLCIDAPSDDNGEPGGAPIGEPGGVPGTAGAPVDGGAGGAGGSGGSGVDGGAPQAGEGGEAGRSGRGGTSPSGGTRSSGGTGATSDGGESDGGAAGYPEAGNGGVPPGGAAALGGAGGFAGRAGGAGGAPSGGKSGRGGTGPTGGTIGTGGFAGDLLCAPPDAFTDTCGGMAGAGGDDGGRYCGSGTSPSRSGEVELGAGGTGPGITLYPIDNLDDGDVLTEEVFGGLGSWYASNDGSGQQFPTACPGSAAYGMFPVPGGRAFHTYGSGFTNLNGFATIGLSFRASPPACDMPIDASVAHGIRFRARGSVVFQQVRVSFGTTATNPVEDGGTCTVGCYDGFGTPIPLGPDFQTFEVYFGTVAQEGWGTPAIFDPSKILNIQWNGQLPCFDFWIDDIAFFRTDI